MTVTFRHTTCALASALLFCLWGGTEGQAQTPPSASAKIDTFVAIVPHHPIEDIERGTAYVKDLRAKAELRLDRATEDVRVLGNLVGTQEVDLEALEQRLDALDSDNQASEIANVKQKIASVERFRDLLTLRKEVREGEVQTAEAVIAYAEAQENLYDREVALTKRRTERDALARKSGLSSDIALLDLAIRKMENEVLDLWEKALKSHEESVSEEQDLLDLFRKLGEAQASFHSQ
jgi:hypothetical protein